MAGIFANSVCMYLDDILIYNKIERKHAEHLELVLALLSKQQLYAKLSKCEFQKQKLKFLGHIVSAQGIQVDMAKVQVICDWPQPTTVKEVRSFLAGLANYFRRFVQGYSSLVAPMIELTKQDTLLPGDWTVQCGEAFAAIKMFSDQCCPSADRIPNPNQP